ncbi:MAG: hypothetical protein ACR2NS_13830 [Gemmatimonadaceae bacterium]
MSFGRITRESEPSYFHRLRRSFTWWLRRLKLRGLPAPAGWAVPKKPPLEDLVPALKWYAEKPVIRAFMQLIPTIGGGADLLLTERWQQHLREREHVFFSALGSGEIQLDDALLTGNDFLHCFTRSLEAAVRARRSEKTAAFGRLLRGAITSQRISDTDRYEELLEILEGLTGRDMIVLSTIERYEEMVPFTDADDNKLQWTNRYWDSLTAQIVNTLGISRDELGAVLFRLARTGCYVPITGAYMDYEGNQGYLSDTYRELKLLLGFMPVESDGTTV